MFWCHSSAPFRRRASVSCMACPTLRLCVPAISAAARNTFSVFRRIKTLPNVKKPPAITASYGYIVFHIGRGNRSRSDKAVWSACRSFWQYPSAFGLRTAFYPQQRKRGINPSISGYANHNAKSERRLFYAADRAGKRNPFFGSVPGKHTRFYPLYARRKPAILRQGLWKNAQHRF